MLLIFLSFVFCDLFFVFCDLCFVICDLFFVLNFIVFYIMNQIQKRVVLFLIGCIGTRTLLVYLAKTANKYILSLMGYISIIIGLGFITIYLTGIRKTGAEVFGDKIWWNNLRPIHGILYLLFSYYAINGNRNAWIYLFIDVIIGLSSFLYFHYKNGDFKYVIV
jgi:hypothetical protein